MCTKNCAISVILSVILGIIIGGLFSAGLITVITAGIIIALIFAAIALLYLIIAIKGSDDKKCLCNNGVCVLVGSIGSIITGVIGLSVTLTTAFLGILLVGLIGFFFALTVISIFLLFLCLLKNKCYNNYCDCYNDCNKPCQDYNNY